MTFPVAIFFQFNHKYVSTRTSTWSILLGFSSDQVQHSRPKAAAPRAATYSIVLNSKEFHSDLQPLGGKNVGPINKRNTQKGLFSGATFWVLHLII